MGGVVQLHADLMLRVVTYAAGVLRYYYYTPEEVLRPAGSRRAGYLHLQVALGAEFPSRPASEKRKILNPETLPSFIKRRKTYEAQMRLGAA